MTWFGSPGFLIALLAVAVVGLVLDWFQLHAGRTVRNHRRVPHRKLRAAAEARRKPATGSHARCNAPVAGPELQAGAHRAWMRDTTGSATGGVSRPAPLASAEPGAGTRAATAVRFEARTDLPPGGPGPQRLSTDTSGQDRTAANPGRAGQTRMAIPTGPAPSSAGNWRQPPGEKAAVPHQPADVAAPDIAASAGVHSCAVVGAAQGQIAAAGRDTAAQTRGA